MKKWAYYNEIDAFAASWIRELIKAGLVPDGEVDERDIRDVRPDDVVGFSQCHWFGGVAGWSYALRLAGWPDDRPVWTGSCPCQPFSAAGRGGGFADERHLWPAFFHLISECRPPVVFGEQVASKDGLGWLDLVHADLEGAGYACRAADLPAAGVGAPHIRQRLFWAADCLANAGHERYEPVSRSIHGLSRCPPTIRDVHFQSEGGSRVVGVADSLSPRLEGRDARALGHEREAAERGGTAGAVGDAAGREQRRLWQSNESVRRKQPARGHGPWDDLIWLPCRDGKARPAQPGIQPLAHGVPNRVGTLRGAGNAIVSQAGAAFVMASMEAQA